MTVISSQLVLRPGAALLAIVVCCCATLAAQEKPAVDPATQLKQQRDSIISKAMTDALYNQCLTRTMLEIDEFRREVDLPAASIKRLQLAAKGAASQYAEKQTAGDVASMLGKVPPLVRWLDVGGVLVTLPVPKKDEGRLPKLEEEEEPPSEIQNVYPKIEVILNETSVTWYFRQQKSSSGYGRGGGYSNVTRHPIWVKALDSNVTKEQRTKVEEVRRRRLSQSAADLCTGLVSAKVRLSDPQRDQVQALIRKCVEKQAITRRDFDNRGYSVVKKVLNQKEMEGLREILTDDQWNLWKLCVQKIRTGNF